MYTLEDMQKAIAELRARRIDICGADIGTLVEREQVIKVVLVNAMTGTVVTASIAQRAITVDNHAELALAKEQRESGRIDQKEFIVRCYLVYDKILENLARIALFETGWYEQQIAQLEVRPKNPLLEMNTEEIASCIKDVIERYGRDGKVGELCEALGIPDVYLTASRNPAVPVEQPKSRRAMRDATGKFTKKGVGA